MSLDPSPSGIVLARRYYHDLVAPLLADVPHAAGRLGAGSDVLGLDDDVSRDHDWGLRLTILVPDAHVVDVVQRLDRGVPDHYAGRPTRFALTRDPEPRLQVEVTTAETFVASRLGFTPTGELDAVDWLSLTGQSLLEVTAGPVFADSLGTLTRLRRTLEWYPDPVWRYVVAAGWTRIGEDLPLLGRAGQRGDELGSRLLAARVVQAAVHLAFMLERRWSPYPKWAGTMLAGLPVGARLVPALGEVLAAPTWQGRQDAVAAALAVLGQAQRDAGLPVPSAGVTEAFFTRPFLGVRAEVADLLLAGVADPVVRRLPLGLGAVEQWTDSVAVLTDPARRVRVARDQLWAVTTD